MRRRRQLDARLLTARDDWGMVEVRANGHGAVVEVAIDPVGDLDRPVRS